MAGGGVVVGDWQEGEPLPLAARAGSLSLAEIGSFPIDATVPAVGALRYNEGKPQLSYLLTAPRACEGLARVFEYGAQKYAKHNWQKGLDRDALIDSLLRHLMAVVNGEVVDSESGQLHVDHVHWNALVLAEQHRSIPTSIPEPAE